MKTNHKKLTGVQHKTQSEQHYHLRRYLPDNELKPLIEQFWLVNWDLKGKPAHTQKNLPDPNFHLVLDQQKLTLIGPVSKSYAYTMEHTGKIIGVKFELGALAHFLALPMESYVDQKIAFKQLVNFDTEALITTLNKLDNDEQIVKVLQTHIAQLALTPSPELINVRELVAKIKTDASITKVEHLAEKSNTSVRTIQRYFKQYIGLSPKWLIRKYRLHHALELLENQTVNILDIVELLGYTDQSHLIRDFKEIIGVTPKRYIQQ